MALSAVALLLLAPMMNANPAPDKDGHVLTALWKQYEEASKADRPQQEAEILTKIKTQYVETVQRRDWKKRAELRENLQKEVEAFNHPMVTYQWMGSFGNASSDERWEFVKNRAKAFREGHNTALYRGVDGLMGGAMKDFMASDYEYVLWHLLGSRSYSDINNDEIYKALKAEVDGKYPAEGYLAYYVANRTEEIEVDVFSEEDFFETDVEKNARKAALEAVAKKYAGTAVAFWPRQEIFRIEFNDLNEAKAGQAAYQALYHKCLTYEKERGALKGDEAKIAKGCEAVRNLTNTLTAKDVRVRLMDKKACVIFRNLDKATLTLREDKKTLKTWNVTKFLCPGYREDRPADIARRLLYPGGRERETRRQYLLQPTHPFAGPPPPGRWLRGLCYGLCERQAAG